MVRDPHPRSAHRANPGSGLATLTRTAAPAQHRRPAIPAQRRHAPGVAQPTPHRRAAGAQQPTPHRRAAGRPVSASIRQFLRAASAANPLALIRPGIGRHTPPPVLPRALRHVPPEPQQALHFVLSSLGALIVLSIVALTVFFVIAEESRGPVADASAAAVVAPESITSRQTDAAPLTRHEVFPAEDLTPGAGAAAYRVVSAQADDDCGVGVTGDLGPLLAENGCSQVVRARLTAPYGGYQVTAGIFNLADENAATRASERAGALVEAGTGTFASLAPAAAGSPVTPLAQMNWHSQGHYLLYCAVARPDGALVADDDPYAARIATEILERHLADGVIAKRATAQP